MEAMTSNRVLRCYQSLFDFYLDERVFISQHRRPPAPANWATVPLGRSLGRSTGTS